MFNELSVTAAGSRRQSIAIVTILVAALLALGVQQAPPAHAAPVVGKFGPSVTATGVGVTISGDGFIDVTGVTFLGTADPADDVAAEHFISLDPKKLVVQVPTAAVTGRVEVTTATGSVPSSGDLTIVPAPVITALSTPSGAPGTTFTITGENLMGSKKPKVLLGSKGAGLGVIDQTSLEVKIPSVPGGPYDLTVLTTGGTAKGSFYVAPTVKKATPGAVTSAGGSVITISGTGFTGIDNFVDDPATAGVDERFNGVTIGGVNVTQLIAVSDKEVVVETPPGVDPAAPIVVSTTDGSVVASSTSAATLQYQPLPTVTSVSPDWNAVDIPAPVTVTGQNLTETTNVLVGGLPVTDKTVNAVAGTVTFTPPAIPKAGPAKLSFTNSAGGVDYSVVVPLNIVTTPIVTKLAPVTGPAGTDVLVTGTGLASGTTVTFGGQPASCTVVKNYVTWSCTAPAGVADGPADVVVTNGVGASLTSVKSVFTYTTGTPSNPPSKLAPAVAGLAPAYGTTGSTVALKGKNLHTATRVQFSGAANTWVDATDYLKVSPSRLVVKVPAGAVSGELRITNPDGVVRSDAKVLDRTVAPKITSIDTVGDQTYGVTPNDFLTIRGSGLSIKKVKTLVTIGGAKAAVLARPRPTSKSITVKVPKSDGGRQQVVVSTPLGTATAETYAYYLPEVKGGKPFTTSRDGGVPVQIKGMGFTGIDNVTAGVGRLSSVRFGGVPAAAVVVMSDKELVAVTAPGSASADELIVRTQHEGRIGDSEGDVKGLNVPTPTLVSVTPDNAQVGVQPPTATITGTLLSTDTVVTFGGAPATVQTAAADGTSMVVVPPIGETTGPADVKVTNIVDGDEVSTTLAGGYTYTPAPATISGLSASTAPAGTSVAILGAGFIGVTSVEFGGVPVPYTVANSGTIFTTVPLTPAGAMGTTVDVTVVNSTGAPSTTELATDDDWTWDSAPMITGMFFPTTDAGSTVTITGTSFTGATNVLFGSVPADAFVIIDDTTIMATVPVTPSSGSTADVIVVGAGGETQAPLDATANDWTWAPIAVITAMPLSGTAGTSITITGQNFTGTTAVLFDVGAGTTSAAFTVVNDTTINVTVPARPGNTIRGERPVYVVNGSGAKSEATHYFSWM